MTQEQLSAIRERCDSAIPGPWEHCFQREYYGQGYGEVAHLVCIGDELLKIGTQCSPDKKYDNLAEFIAHSRNDIPALLDALKEMTQERDAAIKGARAHADNPCLICIHRPDAMRSCDLGDINARNCCVVSRFASWEWRGVQDEKEENDEKIDETVC